MKTLTDKERRFIEIDDVEFRAEETDGKKVLSGYAAVFNKRSENLGGFVEILRPGCFRNALIREDAPTVVALFNHDEGRILGSSDNGTLALEENQTGLKFRTQLPDTPTANEVWTLVRDGYLKKCSFAFTIAEKGDDWKEEKDGLLREIREVSGIYDVSVVTRPAYNSTSVSARALETAKQLSEKPPEDRGQDETGGGSPTVDHELENLRELLEIESLIHQPTKKQEE